LKVQVESGTRLTSTGELAAMGATEWERQKREYEAKLPAKFHEGAAK
jgi:hypothetical protein